MFKNYLKVAFRNAKRYKGFTTLNLLGLIVGLTTSTLILMWVYDEISVDKFHTQGDKIYQVFRNMRQTGGVSRTTWTVPKPAADMLREEYSEVNKVEQISWPVETEIENGDINITETGYFATSGFFELFSFDLLLGDKSSVLADFSSTVISRSLAEKFFGSSWREKAIGSGLTFDDEQFFVTGVFEDVGDNSSLQFDWILPAQYFFNENDWVDDWGNGSFRIYFTLEDESKLALVAERMKDIIKIRAAGQNNAGDEELFPHKFKDYYLYSNFTNGVVDGGRIGYVRLMTIVAIFILLVACINFMNLATARSSRRSKEVGLRKVMGAQKRSIGWQFLFESILISAMAMATAIVFVVMLAPVFGNLLDKNLALDFTQEITWIYMVSITMIVGILSGIYPAILLPKFGIINSLKGTVKQGSSAGLVRRVLVVFQFGISFLLIIGISVVLKQLQYVLNKDLGLNKENLIAIDINYEMGSKWQTLKTELNKIPNVKSVSVASGNPLQYNRSTSSASWEGKNPNEDYEINIMLTDETFLKTTEIELLNGRDFSAQMQDSTNFLINEVAANLMGFEDPINKKLSFWGIDGKIVGVIRNYHMSDMYESISPLIISCIDPARSDVALVRVNGNPMEVLSRAEEILLSMSSEYEFSYEFVDESYAESYNTEFMISNLMKGFAGISIFLSCLGLFGLSAFTAEQRTKEIGIRKVHGATIGQLIILMSKDYGRLMIFAFILAASFAYYFSNQWLNDFEFRTNIDPLLFVVAGLIVFLIGALTVSLKSYGAAKVNPVETLRDE